MIRRPPRSTRTDTLFPYTTRFRSAVGVNIGAGAQFPKAGIGLIVNLPCSLAHFFQGEEVFMSAHAIQPLVDIGLNRGQDDLTISDMLSLLVGLITDANRTHAPITGQGRQLGRAHD